MMNNGQGHGPNFARGDIGDEECVVCKLCDVIIL